MRKDFCVIRKWRSGIERDGLSAIRRGFERIESIARFISKWFP